MTPRFKTAFAILAILALLASLDAGTWHWPLLPAVIFGMAFPIALAALVAFVLDVCLARHEATRAVRDEEGLVEEFRAMGRALDAPVVRVRGKW